MGWSRLVLRRGMREIHRAKGQRGESKPERKDKSRDEFFFFLRALGDCFPNVFLNLTYVERLFAPVDGMLGKPQQILMGSPPTPLSAPILQEH